MRESFNVDAYNGKLSLTSIGICSIIGVTKDKRSGLTVDKMENNSIPKWHLAGLLVVLIILLTSCGINSDLRDIAADISTYSTVFKSERGFGNDRFDVYSFSLKKPEDIGGFHKMGEESEKILWDFLSMIDSEVINDPSRASSLKAIKADLN